MAGNRGRPAGGRPQPRRARTVGRRRPRARRGHDRRPLVEPQLQGRPRARRSTRYRPGPPPGRRRHRPRRDRLGFDLARPGSRATACWSTAAGLGETHPGGLADGGAFPPTGSSASRAPRSRTSRGHRHRGIHRRAAGARARARRYRGGRCRDRARRGGVGGFAIALLAASGRRVTASTSAPSGRTPDPARRRRRRRSGRARARGPAPSSPSDGPVPIDTVGGTILATAPRPDPLRRRRRGMRTDRDGELADHGHALHPARSDPAGINSVEAPPGLRAALWDATRARPRPGPGSTS